MPKKTVAYLALLPPSLNWDLAYLARCLAAQEVLLFDTCCFSRKGMGHRVAFRDGRNRHWSGLNVSGLQRKKPFYLVEVTELDSWIADQQRLLPQLYTHAFYFDYYFPEWIELLSSLSNQSLRDIHHEVSHWLLSELNVALNWTRCSEKYLMDSGVSDIARLSGAQRIVLDEQASRIHPQSHLGMDFSLSLPKYRQAEPGFLSGCGALDLLFNYGPEAYQVIEKLHFSAA